jgi:putative SOS response-associated peptidase YedK
LLTCSVLTTAALGELRRVHDRMPLILPPDRWAGWLAGGGEAAELLQPMTERELAAIEVRPVGPAVGNVRNNGPELLDPPVEVTLF